MTRRERLDHITLFLDRHIVSTNHLFEVRGLRTDGHVRTAVTAVCRNAAKGASIALWMEDKGCNVYFTVNPISPDSEIGRLVRRHGKVDAILRWSELERSDPRAAGDSDIACRRLLLVDLDPVRGKKCSTTAEKEQARVVARAVRSDMTSRGWPMPAVIDSGNGYHLLYRVPPEAQNHDITVILHYLQRLHGTEGVDVDTSVSNAARISRMPWTVNRKGEDTPERPWRLARLMQHGDEAVVSIDTLKAFVAEGRFAAPATAAAPALARSELVATDDEVASLITLYSDYLQCDRAIQVGSETHWPLLECPFVSRAHEGQDLGGGRSKTAIIKGLGYLGFRCFAGGCAEHTLHDLLALLADKTGIEVEWDVYAPWSQSWETRWGGVEDVRYVVPQLSIDRSAMLAWQTGEI